jgi:hypothetical protein
MHYIQLLCTMRVCDLAHISSSLNYLYWPHTLIFHLQRAWCIGNWSSGYTAVTGGENICIGDQELQVVFAPVRQCFI